MNQSPEDRIRGIRQRREAANQFRDRLRKAGTTDRMLLDTLVGAFELGYKTAQGRRSDLDS